MKFMEMELRFLEDVHVVFFFFFFFLLLLGLFLFLNGLIFNFVESTWKPTVCVFRKARFLTDEIGGEFKGTNVVYLQSFTTYDLSNK